MYQIQGDSIVLSNGETYTFHELQFLRWELNGWKRLARITQLNLEASSKKDAEGDVKPHDSVAPPCLLQ